MNHETLAALKASIRHWQENVAAETPSEASISALDCALCEMFSENSPECDGCPVSAAAGHGFCDNTPYHIATQSRAAWGRNPYSLDYMLAWRKAAQAELDFLMSLLPKEESS